MAGCIKGVCVEVPTTGVVKLNSLVTIPEECTRITIQNIDASNAIEVAIAYDGEDVPATGSMGLINKGGDAMLFDWGKRGFAALYVHALTAACKAYIWFEAV